MPTPRSVPLPLAEAEEEGHLEHLRVVDPVLPQAILAPAIAVVPAHHDRRIAERGQQRGERRVAVLQAQPLPAAALGGVVPLREGDARVARAVPGGPLVVIRHVRLADVQEGEDRTISGTPATLAEPIYLFRHGPGVAR